MRCSNCSVKSNIWDKEEVLSGICMVLLLLCSFIFSKLCLNGVSKLIQRLENIPSSEDMFPALIKNHCLFFLCN